MFLWIWGNPGTIPKLPIVPVLIWSNADFVPIKMNLFILKGKRNAGLTLLLNLIEV